MSQRVPAWRLHRASLAVRGLLLVRTPAVKNRSGRCNPSVFTKAVGGGISAVTPDTILRWHRSLVAKKWDYSNNRKSVGRPRICQVIVDLILRVAKETPSWRYDRIQRALANVGCQIADQTVGNILKEHGIEPADDRKRQTTWTTFIKSHWDVLAAIDFKTVEVWTGSGLVTYYLLLVMELATRRVHLAACTPTLGDHVMKQIARNLTDPFDGFLKDKRYVLMDRDAKPFSTNRSAIAIRTRCRNPSPMYSRTE